MFNWQLLEINSRSRVERPSNNEKMASPAAHVALSLKALNQTIQDNFGLPTLQSMRIYLAIHETSLWGLQKPQDFVNTCLKRKSTT